MKLKEGQEVWCFTTRNPHDHDDIKELWDEFNIEDIHLTKVNYDELWEDRVICYLTKEDAIDAALKRINELK